MLNKLKWQTVYKIWGYWHCGSRGHKWKRFLLDLEYPCNLLYQRDFEYGGHRLENAEDDWLDDSINPNCRYYYPYSTIKRFYRCTAKEHFEPLRNFLTNKHHRKITWHAWKYVMTKLPKALLDLIMYYLPWRCHGNYRPRFLGIEYTRWTVDFCRCLEDNWREREYREGINI